MRLRRTTPLLALAAVLVLGGCGKEAPVHQATPSAPSSSPTPRAAPATGPLLSGTGYAFHLPRGWEQRTREYKRAEKEIEVAGADAPDASGIADAVKVRVTDSAVAEPDDTQLQEISTTITRELRTRIPKLVVNHPTEIADQPALDHEGALAQQGTPYYIHQFIAFKGGKAYAITFQFSRATTGKQRSEIIGPVLASWTWR